MHIYIYIYGISQNLGYLLGVPIIRIIVFLGLCEGSPI